MKIRHLCPDSRGIPLLRLVEASFCEKSGHGWPFWWNQSPNHSRASTIYDTAIRDDRTNKREVTRKQATLSARPPQNQPSCIPEEIPAGGQFSSLVPSARPLAPSTSLISVSDFLPRFGVFSSSTSVFCTRSPM